MRVVAPCPLYQGRAGCTLVTLEGCDVFGIFKVGRQRSWHKTRGRAGHPRASAALAPGAQYSYYAHDVYLVSTVHTSTEYSTMAAEYCTTGWRYCTTGTVLYVLL